MTLFLRLQAIILLAAFAAHTSAAASIDISEPVPSLQDLVGARGSSGETQLKRRGYRWAGTSKRGGDAYSYYREEENGQCIVVRTSDGRYASIGYATESDCAQAARSGRSVSVDSGEGGDEYGTVCGVIVDGSIYRYPCSARDIYADSQKVGTILRYPDMTIELTWRSGNRVGLQFEGMVPTEVRYSTSEGETNFIFEDKTYFYYSNRELARRELESLPE